METAKTLFESFTTLLRPLFDEIESAAQGPHAPLSEVIHEVFNATKLALSAWMRLILPSVVFLLRFVWFLLQLGWKWLSVGFEYIRPHLITLFNKTLETYDEMTPQEKIVLYLVMTAALLLYLIQRWFARRRFLHRFTVWLGAKKTSAVRRYTLFLEDLRKRSRILASIFPHVQYIGSLYALRRLGLVNWLLDSNVFFIVIALGVPLLRTLETSLVLSKIQSDGWKRYIVGYNRYAHAILGKKTQSKKLPSSSSASSPASSSFSNGSVAGNNIDISDLIPGPELSERQKAAVVLLGETNVVEPTTEEEVEFDAVYSSDAFLSHHYTSLQSLARYWVSFSSIWLLSHIPLVSYAMRTATNKYPYLPLALVIWLQSPITDGSTILSHIVTTVFARYKAPSRETIEKMIAKSVQLSSQIAASVDSKSSDQSATSNTHKKNTKKTQPLSEEASLALVKQLSTVADLSAARDNEQNETEGTKSGWLRMFLSLPFVPSFVRKMFETENESGGFFLFASVLFLFTPGFITSYGCLMFGIVRPAYATLVALRKVKVAAASNIWFDSIVLRVQKDTLEATSRRKNALARQAREIDRLRSRALGSTKSTSTDEYVVLLFFFFFVHSYMFSS